MVKRVLTGILVFLGVLGALLIGRFFGTVWLSAIIGVVTVICIAEVRRAFGKRIPGFLSAVIYIYAVLIVMPVVLRFVLDEGISFDPGKIQFFITVLFFTLTFAVCVMRGVMNEALFSAAFLLLYPAYPLLMLQDLSAFTSFGAEFAGVTAVALVITVSSMTDTFALIFGKKFGKNKLAPEISPNKTVAGAVGGLIGGLFGAAVIYVLCEEVCLFNLGLGIDKAWVVYILVGLFGSAFSQIGDLAASIVKRILGVKDFSRLLGSHGGFMDRFDGVMFNAVLVSLLLGLAVM